MIRSKRALEGYLQIDHRFSPGVPAEEQRRMLGLETAELGPHGHFERATLTCAHCQAMVIVNPLRNRDRGWCHSCDRYLCDRCAGIYGVDRQCRSFASLIENWSEALALRANVREV